MYKIQDLTPVQTQMKSFGLDPQKIAQESLFALSTINNNDKLLSCSKASIFTCIVDAANLGLTLNPQAQECALIPRKNRDTGQYECSLMPMYQGIANLAYKSGNITQLITKEVRQKDSFEVSPYDITDPIKHSYGFGDRGEPIGYYTLIVFSDGSKQAESMSIEDVLKIRDCSDGYKYARNKEEHPWGKWFSEMARKACLKRALKYVNTTKAPEKLLQAIDLDNKDYIIQSWQVHKINNLLVTSTLDPEQKALIEDGLTDMSANEAHQTIQQLELNQLPNHPGYNDRVGKMQLGTQVLETVERENT